MVFKRLLEGFHRFGILCQSLNESSERLSVVEGGLCFEEQLLHEEKPLELGHRIGDVEWVKRLHGLDGNLDVQCRFRIWVNPVGHIQLDLHAHVFDDGVQIASVQETNLPSIQILGAVSRGSLREVAHEKESHWQVHFFDSLTFHFGVVGHGESGLWNLVVEYALFHCDPLGIPVIFQIVSS